jgi:hypothetical protein
MYEAIAADKVGTTDLIDRVVRIQFGTPGSATVSESSENACCRFGLAVLLLGFFT